MAHHKKDAGLAATAKVHAAAVTRNYAIQPRLGAYRPSLTYKLCNEASCVCVRVQTTAPCPV
jgi:hypothetical protein